MKEYQVVSVGEAMAWRNNKICYQNLGEIGIAKTMEVMLNSYSQDGWTIKKMFYVNNPSSMNDDKVLIVFERKLLDSEKTKILRKQKKKKEL